MSKTSFRSVAFIFIAVVAGFAIFYFAAFLPFWSHAMDLREANSHRGLGFGVTDAEFARLRFIFWFLYGGLLIVPLALSALVARLTKSAWWAATLVALPIWGFLAFMSFGLLEFMNACEVGESFYLDASC